MPKSAAKKQRVSRLNWVQVNAQTPVQVWWPNICQTLNQSRLQKQSVDASQTSFAQLADFQRTRDLFGVQKAMMVSSAEKLVVKQKGLEEKLESLAEGLHFVFLISEQRCPKQWLYGSFDFTEDSTQTDDKIVFKWIDAIDAKDLSRAMKLLDRAHSANNQHPLVFLQLLNRHFRVGRLVIQAEQSQTNKAKLLSDLKIPEFIYRKWSQRKNQRIPWQSIFQQLLKTDLEYKSGADGVWPLQLLSTRLINGLK